MSNPKVTDVHNAGTIPTFSLRKGQLPLVGALLAPLVPVSKETDKFYVHGQEHLKVKGDFQGNDGYANQLDWTLSTDSYVIEAHGLSKFISDRAVRNQDNPLNLVEDAQFELEQSMALNLEDAVATMAATAANFGTTVTLAGTQLWSDYDVSDPMADIQTAMDTVRNAALRMPNAMLIGNAVWPELRHHPQLLERIKYTGSMQAPSQVTLDMLKDIFGLEHVLVGEARKDTANEGAAASLSNVWDDDVFVFITEPGLRVNSYSWAKTFFTTKATKRIRDERRGQGGVYIEMNFNYDIKVVATAAAYAIYSAT